MDSQSEDIEILNPTQNFSMVFFKHPNQVRSNDYFGMQQNKIRIQIPIRPHYIKRQKIEARIQKENLMFQQKVLVSEPISKTKNSPSLQKIKPKSNKSFQDLKIIKPILKAVNDLNYIKPTPIQQLAIPIIASGKDIVASSITGSGKTAAFLIPIIQRYYNVAAVGYIRVLVVSPTRELAIQIYEDFEKLNKYTKLDGVLVIGASSIQRQQQSLRNNPQIVVATPGRIIDVLMNSRSVGIQNLEVIVFDEADKLLQLGFEHEIKEIMKYTRPEVQTIMFSATMGKDIEKLASVTTRKPIRISADPDNKTAEKLHQQIIRLKQETQEYREAVLTSILANLYKDKVIVFFKTKKQCHRMAIILGLLGLKACELHGNLSQTQRIQAFLDFKEGKFDFLLATDLASRGLDIKDVKTVINFELPSQLTKYIHRIGRTARAGNVGTSLTICSDLQCLELKKMSKKTGDKLFKLSINNQAAKSYKNTIIALERQIGSILAEERQERDLRRADMELKKLQNITDHSTEIYSRPKKQWFVTQKQKKQIQEKAKAECGVVLNEQTKVKPKNKFNRQRIKNKQEKPDRKGKVQKRGKMIKKFNRK